MDVIDRGAVLKFLRYGTVLYIDVYSQSVTTRIQTSKPGMIR